MMHTNSLSATCSRRKPCFQSCSHRRVPSVRQVKAFRQASVQCSAKVKSANPVCSSRTDLEVSVEKTSWNSRMLFARIQVSAPLDAVWSVLTDYENLHTFIPSLVENKCLERRPHGAVLHQVGAQDVALGVKFCAACTLECTEYLEGIPSCLCSSSASTSELLFPHPRLCDASAESRDISFRMLEGDFQSFRGIWRMQRSPTFSDSALLCYALYVKPQQWLPVGLISNRIEREVCRNLEAVRVHAEKMHCMNLAEI